jgi:hypothetical protein
MQPVVSYHASMGCLAAKGKGKSRYLGRFRHCSRVDLLYPCPQGFPSFISRGPTYHAGTRPLLEKEVTIQEFS